MRDGGHAVVNLPNGVNFFPLLAEESSTRSRHPLRLRPLTLTVRLAGARDILWRLIHRNQVASPKGSTDSLAGHLSIRNAAYYNGVFVHVFPPGTGKSVSLPPFKKSPYRCFRTLFSSE
jgi:hypothetical protein